MKSNTRWIVCLLMFQKWKRIVAGLNPHKKNSIEVSSVAGKEEKNKQNKIDRQ